MPSSSISAAARTLSRLLAHLDKTLDLDGINYVALRAYKAAGRNVSFNEMSGMTGAAPVTGALIPVLVTFTDRERSGDRACGAAG